MIFTAQGFHQTLRKVEGSERFFDLWSIQDIAPVTTSSKKLLIVAETFPPMPGIGGRRWAKFAKYLHELGVEVYILTRAYSGEEQSLWSADVIQLPQDRIYTYVDGYPDVLRKTKLSLVNRFRYKVALSRVMRRTKGNPYDRAVFIEKDFTARLSELVDAHSIATVVVSGPSFNLVYYAAQLRQTRNDFKLWVDFRDGWTWDARYGMGIISASRKVEEARKEKHVVTYADRILTPSEFHFEQLRRLYPEAASKMEVTPHAFDRDDLPSLAERHPKGDHYIYGGTLYDGLEPVFEALNRSFAAIHPKTVTLDLYLSNPHKLDHYLALVDERWHPYFKRHKQVSPKAFYAHVSGAKAFIFWAGVPTKISSKVYEILACGTPIINVSERGELAEFLEQNALGKHFTPDEFCFAHIDGIFDGLNRPNEAVTVFPDYKTLASTLAKAIE